MERCRLRLGDPAGPRPVGSGDSPAAPRLVTRFRNWSRDMPRTLSCPLPAASGALHWPGGLRGTVVEGGPGCGRLHGAAPCPGPPPLTRAPRLPPSTPDPAKARRPARIRRTRPSRALRAAPEGPLCAWGQARFGALALGEPSVWGVRPGGPSWAAGTPRPHRARLGALEGRAHHLELPPGIELLQALHSLLPVHHGGHRGALLQERDAQPRGVTCVTLPGAL